MPNPSIFSARMLRAVSYRLLLPRLVAARYRGIWESGANCIIRGWPRINATKGTRIMLGQRVALNSQPIGYHAGMPFPVTLNVDHEGAIIEIGDDSRLHGCCVHSWSRVAIGHHCLLAGGSQILDSHGHPSHMKYARLRVSMTDEPQPITIGDYCWICAGAMVLKGVTLGEGCVVAANSVVTKGDYPAFSLLAGNPAQVMYTLPATDILPADFPLDALVSESVVETK